jgi:hypothetical protein
MALVFSKTFRTFTDLLKDQFNASIAKKARSGIRPSRASRAARRMRRRFLLPIETPPCLSVFIKITSIRQIELLQQRGVSRVVAQVLQQGVYSR